MCFCDMMKATDVHGHHRYPSQRIEETQYSPTIKFETGLLQDDDAPVSDDNAALL